MTNSINSTTATSQVYLQQAQQAHQQQVKQKAVEPKDTVTLSPKAQAAASDSDHDGH
ncbi:MAG TPA: hypothetical protein VKT81_16220 [Bryobacteraceae bacterium]|nr:hypothetical protein [Bryobacteraceae bacterium]